ncbi:MAG: phage protease [Planctomycetota bacterium]|nr:phage protease [Planctomycetota bacterium]
MTLESKSVVTLSEKIKPHYSVQHVALASEDGTVDPGDSTTPKWQHVASEGQFLGYRGGTDPFAFTRETFDEIVANFRKNPQYKAGADGIGESDVIPWDFEHASEMYAADGNIPTDGSPAQGWVRELKVLDAADGTAQLWALSLFLPTALEYIKARQYKWSSVAVIISAVDSISGERIGAVLTSIALTNQPFITGLQPLAASAKETGKNLRVSRWYEAAGTALEAVGSIKDLFGLKELAPLSEVMGEVAKLRQWIESGTTPVGIDLMEIFGALKQILSLGALTTEIDVLDALGKIAQRAIEEQAVAEGAAVTPPEPIPGDDNAATTARKTGETEMLKNLASKFGVKEIESEVLEAAGDAVELRADAAKALSTSTKSKDIVDSINMLTSDKEKHVALLKALGVDSADDAVACVADLQKDSKALKDLKPEFEKLDTRIKEIDLKAAEAEVDMVIAANKFDPAIKDALMLQRKQDPEKFAEKFPVDAEKLKLTQKVTDGVVTPDGKPKPPTGEVIDLSLFAGKNKTLRAITYLGSKDPKFTSLNWDNQTQAAHDLIKRENVIDGTN